MWLILGVLVAASSVSLLRYLAVRRTMARLRLVDRMHGVRCDAPDWIGISLLATEGVDQEQVAQLLTVEYARYEVVVVLDAQREAMCFAELCTIYHLIRVEYRPTGELPSAAVRGLYRSRKRRFRRLVLVDMAGDNRVARLDAATDVAAYDYLLPVGRGARLLRGAIERLVVLIGSATSVRSCWRMVVGERAVVCRREEVVAAGGFDHYAAWRCGERLYAPFLEGEPHRWRSRLYALLFLLLFGGGAVISGWLFAGWWLSVAVAMTGVWLWLLWIGVCQEVRFLKF